MKINLKKYIILYIKFSFFCLALLELFISLVTECIKID
jgi:hypothetical protein